MTARAMNDRGQYGNRTYRDPRGWGHYGTVVGLAEIGQDAKSIGEQMQDISKLRNKFHMDWNLKILPKLRRKNEISAVFVRDLGVQLLQIRGALSNLQTGLIKDPRHILATAVDEDLRKIVMEAADKYDQFLDKITPITLAAGKVVRAKGEMSLPLDGPDSYDKLIQGALDESINVLLDLHRYGKALGDLWGPFGKSISSAVITMSKAIDRVVTEVKKVIEELPSPSELIRFAKIAVVAALGIGGVVVVSNLRKARSA